MVTFMNLPLELRRQIWADTVEPRTVPVQTRFQAWAPVPTWAVDRNPKPILTLISCTPVPNVLHICRESRSLNLYQKFFLVDETDSTYVWANTDIDIIDIGDNSDYPDFKHCAPLIRRLKFEADNTIEYWYHTAAKELKTFQNLEACFVVAQDSWENWEEAFTEHSWSCEAKDLWIIDKDRGRMMTFPDLERWMDIDNRLEIVEEFSIPLPQDLAAATLIMK